MADNNQTDEAGSGVTFKPILRDLQATLVTQFAAAITRMPKARREAAVEGFKDGMRAIIAVLTEMRVIVVKESE